MENWFLSAVDLLRYFYRFFIRAEAGWNVSMDVANVVQRNNIKLNEYSWHDSKV